MNTGKWIRNTREARGLGKGALAKKVGVSVGRVTQWENGRAEPRGEEWDRLRAALGEAPPQASASPPEPTAAAHDEPAQEPASAGEPEADPAPGAAPTAPPPGALTAAERSELIARLDAGQPLPEAWRYRLFPASPRTVEIGKEYRLEYQGKLKREAVLADTPAAPWQLVRRFCTDRPFDDGWRNLLVWGDNLLALRELLADQRGPNRYSTRGRIKLVYIDPPFATRQDFMKDKEKAYRDKVLGAQFIEFLRRRLILLREVLADDGSVYVHLDNKKGHYIKAVLDEVMGEENFQNQIVWKRTPFAGSSKARAARFPVNHDTVFFYAKSGAYSFSHQYEPYSDAYKARFKYQDERGFYRKTLLKTYSAETEARLREEGRFIPPQKPGAHPSYKQYLHESKGKQVEDIWPDINIDNPMAQSRAAFDYPTMKPEALLERIVRASSSEGDIVLDAFAGSGTTAAVAEKLGRRWIAMDCGKLAIYTTQKRLFSLTTTIGSAKKDDRAVHERVPDWGDHLKDAPGLLLITEKARKGECEVTLGLLEDLAALVTKHGLLKKGSALALACPRDKLRVKDDKLDDADEGPGEKQLTVGGVTFRISFVEPKEKAEKDEPLPAREFALYRAGLYDMAAIRAMPWAEYRPFVLKLFGVREHGHTRYGFGLDGYLGTHSVLLWNYPDHPRMTLDYGYVDDLHRTLRGQAGERFYVIAPVVSMSFAEDEVVRGDTTYVFLKVPLSVLLRLLEARPADQRKLPTLPQPVKEADVNEVIDAVGFDFVSQPVVAVKPRRLRPKGEMFHEYVLEVTEFRSQTLATEPEDFANFETFSMAMVDLDYPSGNPEDEGAVFRLSRVFWAEELLKEAGGLEKAKALRLRIEEQEFTGERLMVILCDRYGNEKKLVFGKGEFR